MTRETHHFSEDIFHYNYTSQITRPIRITDRSATIIDNIFCEYTNLYASFREHNYFNIWPAPLVYYSRTFFRNYKC